MTLEIVDDHRDDPAGDGKDATQRQDSRGVDPLEIVVNGKTERFDLTNPEHREELVKRAQMGTNYSQRVAEVNLKEANLQKTYRPYMEFDEIVKTNKDLEDIMIKTLRGEPVVPTAHKAPASNGQNGDDDPNALIADVETRLSKRDDAKEQGVMRVLSRINERLEQSEQRERDALETAKLKRDPLLKGWITDDHIELARDRRNRAGGTLEDNFKILFFHEIPKVVERRVYNDIPPELRRSLFTRESGPMVIDGVTISEERLQELRDNPDEYAKVRRKIREARRKRTGLQPYPGRE